MKNVIYLTSLFCVALLIFSCQPCPECPEVDDDMTLTTEDTISVQTFNTWRANWQAHGKSYIADTLTRYFTMPLIDVTEFEDNKSVDVVAARYHLGIEIQGTNQIPHLMLVGVNSSGADVIDFGNDQFIYDVTLPCPSMCGANSLPKK